MHPCSVLDRSGQRTGFAHPTKLGQSPEGKPVITIACLFTSPKGPYTTCKLMYDERHPILTLSRGYAQVKLDSVDTVSNGIISVADIVGPPDPDFLILDTVATPSWQKRDRSRGICYVEHTMMVSILEAAHATGFPIRLRGSQQ
jgi:hypothetical protein